MHKPIQIKHLSFSLPNKTCFSDFSTDIHYGDKIAIIGRNGSGKTTLLNMILGNIEPTDGEVRLPSDIQYSYIPQFITEYNNLSGGEIFNKALGRAIAEKPDLLILDEPTNNLDRKSRKGLMQMIKNYLGTVIVVSHDTELIRNCINTLWHIDNEKIQIFTGSYDDYMQTKFNHKLSIERKLLQLRKHKVEMHEKLMDAQVRIAKSKEHGKKNIANNKLSKMAAHAKINKADKFQGKSLQNISYTKQTLTSQLEELNLPENILPKFNIATQKSDIGYPIIKIRKGAIGYNPDNMIVSNINFTLYSRDRLAIIGNNGSGKSTFIKAILNAPSVYKTGEWDINLYYKIAYFDQHYTSLDNHLTVLEYIAQLIPHWTHQEIRKYLHDFLFRKNEEVNKLIANLSGGEKARVLLAYIAIANPDVLILDEITNNIDLETKEHIINVIKNYLGTVIVISHDEDFLKAIGINSRYEIGIYSEFR